MNSRVVRCLATLHPPKAPGTIAIRGFSEKRSNLARTTTTTINAQLNRSQSLFFSRSSSNFSPQELEGHDKQADVVPQDEAPQEAATSTKQSGATQQPLGNPGPSLVPIPSLPPPAGRYPTPWIDKEDFSQYLFPLYSCGWGISFSMPKRKVLEPAVNEGAEGVVTDNDVVSIPTGHKPPLRTPHLVGRYKFANYSLAADFLNDIVKLTKSENHHPRILSIENSKTPSVAIVTQTDSAIRPAWGQPRSRLLRGITRRDLRLAWLVETLFRDKCGNAMDMRSVRPSEQAPSWDRLLRRLQGTVLGEGNSTPQDDVRCYACKGPHRIDQCPDRSKIRPPGPCKFCQGEDHWKMDCPVRHRQVYECKLCGMNHPTAVCPQNQPPSKCPNCGGDHWLVDCRVGQISEQRAQEMMLPIPNKA